MGGLVDLLDEIVDRYNDAIHGVRIQESMPGWRHGVVAHKRAADLAHQLQKDLDELRREAERLSREREALARLHQPLLTRVAAQQREIARLRQTVAQLQRSKAEADHLLERARAWGRRALARIRAQ